MSSSNQHNPYESPERASGAVANADLRPSPSMKPASITPRDLFGVAVRGIGLFALWEGIATGCAAYFPAEGFAFAQYAVPAAVALVGGIVLLLGGEAIANLAYGAANGSRA